MSVHAISAKQDRAGRGIALILLAWLMFATVDTTVKWLVLAGLAPFQLAFLRYAISFGLTLIVGARSGRLFGKVTVFQAGLLFLRAALLVTATVCNFYALRFLSLTVTSAIMFSSPIIVCALSVPLLGEKVGPKRWGAILLGFSGVLIVVRPFGEAFHPATLLIVFCATAMALFSIITRRLSGEIAPQVMQSYMGAMGTLVLLPFAIPAWQNPASATDWSLCFVIGASAWAGHEIFARAHLFAPVSTLMPFSYSYLAYMTVGSWLIFATLPDALTVLGAGVIVVSGLIIWRQEAMQEPRHE